MSEIKALTDALRSGQITRRYFVSRTVLLGLSAPAILALIEACQGTGSQVGSSKKSLVVAVDTDIDDLDPNVFKSDAAGEVITETYEMPVDNVTKLGPNGTLEATTDLQGILASSFTVSSDGTKYTFKVRPNTFFSNGHPVTAQAFEYSYQRALLGAGYATLLMNLLTITDPGQLRAVDDSTFEMTLGRPNPMASKLLPLTVLDIMDPVVSNQQATADDKWASKYYSTNIIGTGPYVKGATWQSGSQYLLAPNPKYWNPGKLQNSGILMKYIPSSDDRLLLLERGDIDLAFGLPAKNLDQLRTAKGVKLWTFQSRNTNYMVLNEHIKPFDDVRVRQAIAYALPYDTLIKNVLYGFGKPLKSIVAAGMPTSDESQWQYSTDLQKAKSLLAAAGLPNGFHSSLAVSVSRAEDSDTAVWIQSGLAQVGIKIDIQKLSDANYREKQANDQLPMFIEYWYSWVNDPFYQMFWLMQSKNRFTNLAHYANPEVDALISQGTYNTNDSQRADSSRQAQQIFDRDVPLILLYQRDFVVAARDNVSGMSVYPDQQLRVWTLNKS